MPIPMRGTSFGRAIDLRYGATGTLLEIYVTFFGANGRATNSICVSPYTLFVDVDVLGQLLAYDDPQLELF